MTARTHNGGSAMASNAQKKRRRKLREDALRSLAGLSIDDLVNLRHELGREMNLQSVVVNDIRLRLEAVRVEIDRRKTSTQLGVHVTDHAIVRYLERHKGLDVQAVREEIAALAERARQITGGVRGRRIDDVTGLMIGIDEEAGHVTTVFVEEEQPVLEVLPVTVREIAP